VGAFVGLAPQALRERDAVQDLARLFHAGTLVRQVRNAEGLAAILKQFFGVAAGVEEFVGHWLRLAPADRTRLGRTGGRLGEAAIAGGRVWDHQSKFRIHLGPLTRRQYESFLPLPAAGRASALQELVDWVRFYLCFELDWDVRLHLRRDEVPPLMLGREGRLGWTSWLGTRRTAADADDLVLDPENTVPGKQAA
jgi:type VI secretion system protein ImpH